MSKRNRLFTEPTEPDGVPEPRTQTAAVLDPTESGPPTEMELGGVELGPAEPRQAADDDRDAATAISAVIAVPGEAVATHVNSVTPAAPDCSTIVANLDRQSAAAWPQCSPFTVDWPWSGEPDPVPGDIVGWNWHKQELAVVTGVPPVTAPWPYTLTVEIRPMPPEWQGPVRVFDLNSGQRLDSDPGIEWYTRWNRAYSRFVTDERASLVADESGQDVKRTTGSGWLAVVPEKAEQENAGQ